MLGHNQYKPLSNDVNQGPISGTALKQENTHAFTHNEKFRTFFRERGFQEAAEETGIINNLDWHYNKSRFADKVSGIVSAPGATNNQFTISAPTPSGLIQSNISLSSINPPLLLPRTNDYSQETATRNNQSSALNASSYSSNPSLYTSTKMFLDRNRKRIRAENDDKGKPPHCGPEKGVPLHLRVCGLRHFSMKVCEKVKQKGVTTYNEVADELVQEFSEQSLKNPLAHVNPNSDQSYDQKNIRRRVYDALNVLMAMNIISKEKKEIKWVGLPTNSAHECKHLEEEKSERLERIKQKQQQLKELIVQQIVYKNLVQRNKKEEKKNGTPPANTRIHLPFLIVNTAPKTIVDCSISNDKSEYIFNFDESFEIHDDMLTLKRMGLSYGLEGGFSDFFRVSDENLKSAKTMVPKALQHYVVQMSNGTYGDLNLIQFSKGSRKSKSQPIPPYKMSLPSPGPSHQLSSLKRMVQSSVIPPLQSPQLHRLFEALPVTSVNDTDVDIENTVTLK